MIVKNDKTKSNYSSIMKAIQNQIKDIIIDKFISNRKESKNKKNKKAFKFTNKTRFKFK